MDSNSPVTTASGLQYTDLVVGTGAAASEGATAVVHYTGWLNDGTKFDSSVETHLFADGGDAKVISAERWKMAPIRIINKNNYRGPAYWQNNKSPTKRTGR